MRRMVQIVAAFAFIFLGPTDWLADRFCWWFM